MVAKEKLFSRWNYNLPVLSTTTEDTSTTGRKDKWIGTHNNSIIDLDQECFSHFKRFRRLHDKYIIFFLHLYT